MVEPDPYPLADAGGNDDQGQDGGQCGQSSDGDVELHVIRVADSVSDSLHLFFVAVQGMSRVAVDALVHLEPDEAEDFALAAVEPVAAQIDPGVFWNLIQKLVFEVDVVVIQHQVFQMVQTGQDGRNFVPGQLFCSGDFQTSQRSRKLVPEENISDPAFPSGRVNRIFESSELKI